MTERVFLFRCEAYDDSLNVLVDRIFGELSLYDRIKPGMRVVLKPNLVMRSRPEEAIITHPLFTAAVGDCVKRAGAKVIIAESPGGPYSPAVMKGHFKACGYTDMAQAHGFTLYTDCKYRAVHLKDARLCRELNIAEPFLDRDFLIDLPKLKTHGMTGFSGAVKNLFGVVPGLQKPELHCRFPEKDDFSEMLVDLCAFVKPDVSLMDGVWAMEGNGPTGGQRRDLNIISAALNPFALDALCSSLIGLEPMNVLMLKKGFERGLSPENMQELEISGDAFSSLLNADFKKAKAASTDFIDRLPKFMRPAAKRIFTPYPKIDKKRCAGCGKCAESCPKHTIKINSGKAQIDYSGCIRCFCCHEMCPSHVIDLKRFGI